MVSYNGSQNIVEKTTKKGFIHTSNVKLLQITNRGVGVGVNYIYIYNQSSRIYRALILSTV